MVQHHPALKPVADPVCSICIANYNGVLMLADCLESVLAQQTGVPVEIIVHDDASNDDSVAFLRKHYPQVEILASHENVGFCVGNNRMVAHARGEYVLLLNNDAALFPDALASLLVAARSQEHAGILTLPQYDWQSGALVDRGCLLDPFYNPVPNLDPARRDVAMVIGACLFLPSALWRDLGGFPEWMESIGEDLYLCCIARLRGYCVQALPISGYRHRCGATFSGRRADSSQLVTTFRRRSLSERNKTAAMIVCTPTPQMWPLLALHALLLALEGAVLALLKRDGRVWRDIYGHAFAGTMRAYGALMERRRSVQASRSVSLRVYLSAFVWMPQKLRLWFRHGTPEIR